MQISISIEPYLTAEKSKLIQYLEEIVKISHKFNQGQVNLHFDYFKHNPETFRLVQNYTKQITVDLHLMQESAPSVMGFRSVSCDFLHQPAKMPALNSKQVGLVLDLGCEIAEYETSIIQASYIIIMTVKCGKSGQVFQPAALDLIPHVRRLNPNAIIIIDGGVNENNIETLKNAGVDVVVVGNYAKKCYENGELLIGINRLLHN